MNVVTRQCDTVQTPIVREHLLVHMSMKSVWSLGIKFFGFGVCWLALLSPSLPTTHLHTAAFALFHYKCQYDERIFGVTDFHLSQHKQFCLRTEE